MEQSWVKKLKKIGKRHFTLIVIPTSGAQSIRNFRIPFALMAVGLVVIILNIYVFLTYSTQVWQIQSFRQKIAGQDMMISKLKAEKPHVRNVLNRSNLLDNRLLRYRQENEAMVDTWNRLRRKGGYRFPIASRGIFKRQNYQLNTLNSLSKSSSPSVTTSLEQLGYNLDQLDNILGKEEQQQELIFRDLKASERRLDHRPSIRPVEAQICSPFGVRFHPIYRRYIKHDGVDLAVEYGNKVRAGADGVVKFAGWQAGYGLLIIINHEYGYETRYGHNSKLLVHPGQVVKKGQVICLSGNTGESTGPHVHYEVRFKGEPIDPVPFLKE